MVALQLIALAYFEVRMLIKDGCFILKTQNLKI